VRASPSVARTAADTYSVTADSYSASYSAAAEPQALSAPALRAPLAELDLKYADVSADVSFWAGPSGAMRAPLLRSRAILDVAEAVATGSR